MSGSPLAGAFALAFAAVAASGCGTPVAGLLTGDPFKGLAPITAKLAAFTAADVQAALDDANKNGDVVGSLCWGTVQKALPALQPRQGAGGASAIQLARDVQRKLPEITDACANILPTGLPALVGAL
jgi:hypothetical protein